jgi:hypothetical protein
VLYSAVGSTIMEGEEGQPMGQARYTREEIAHRGEELYEQRIRSAVEPANEGKIIVIDIETGDYEIDEDHLAANARARAKRPDAILYGMRIGHRALGKVGGSWGKPGA